MISSKFQRFENCGQVFYKLTQKNIKHLERFAEEKGLPMSPRLLRWFRDGLEINSRMGFRYAITMVYFGKGEYRHARWFNMPFYKISGRWFRVQWERTYCPRCDWKGEVLNPTYPPLYDYLENKWDLVEEAEKLPQLPCPKCGSRLERHPVWLKTVAGKYWVGKTIHVMANDDGVIEEWEMEIKENGEYVKVRLLDSRVPK